MPYYVIIETEDGLTIAEVQAGLSPETVAEQHAGVIVDPTIYETYEDAYDALLANQEEENGNEPQ